MLVKEQQSRFRKSHDYKTQPSYQRKRVFVENLRMVPCMDCGFVPQIPSQMDLDHRSDKSFNVSRYISKSEAAVIEEAKKCDVVCRNCHALRTYKRRVEYHESDTERNDRPEGSVPSGD